MANLWILILVGLFATNSMENAESVKVKLEELPLKTFDEIFGEGWWDKGEAADLKTPAPTNFGQNVHHQIDRQNTQLRLIEPNSTDQNPALTESDHLGQIEPNSTDQLGQIEPQNRPLTESDHFGQIEPNSTDQLGQIEPNSTDQNTPLTESEHSRQDENSAENERKRKIIDKFHAIKEEFRQKVNFSAKEWNQIERKIANHLNVSRLKIYKWKKEFGLRQRNPKNKRKHLVEKFDQMKAELMRAGFKNSYHHEIDKTVAKELDLSLATIYNWKHELGQITAQHKHSHSEQKELMKCYYEIKDKNPKISNENIAKMLNIARATLINWKRQFKQQKFHPNSVDGHCVEENAGSNVQDIENSNL